MRILVTGASGFIGRHLCSALVRDGHQLIVLSRNPSSALQRLPAGIHAVAWEPVGSSLDLRGIGLVDAVVHLAGESIVGRWTRAKKEAIRASRVVGTRNLVNALASLPSRPKVLVSASATGYYGDGGEVSLTEDAPPGRDFLAQVCVAWEAEAQRAEGLGIRVVCLRAGIVFGPGGGALTPLLVLARFGLGGPLGSGRQWWSWVHMDDLVGLVRLALAQDIRGPVNATAPHPIRQKELARILGRAMKRPAFLPTPGWAVRLLAGPVAQELLFSRKVLPQRALAAGYRFRVPYAEDAVHTILAAG
ncbi:MAG: TIGR01777 family oxidoreductase [Dehalococcoidia bacterium]|nr:TIGR01777 family oxidoreductase [Dehalococcoidia bacterium]MDW8119264.1 TIGR01777 family oxidoreductase [Chloroflexota bacterium]